MKRGTLWAGNYKRSRKFKGPGVRVAAKESPSKSIEKVGQPSQIKNPKNGAFESKILNDQLTKQMMASTMLARSEVSERPLWLKLGSFVELLYGLHSKHFSDESEETRCRLAATFDLDGPCEVVTPFDSELEKLPRPNSRSMSQSWVVEKVEDRSVRARDESQSRDAEVGANAISRKTCSEPEALAEPHAIASSMEAATRSVDHPDGSTTTPNQRLEPQEFLQASEPRGSQGPSNLPQNLSAASPQPDDLAEDETPNLETAMFHRKPARLRVLRKIKGAYYMIDEPMDYWTFN